MQAAVGTWVAAQQGGDNLSVHPAKMVREHHSASAPGLQTLSFLVSKMPRNCQSRSSWSKDTLLKWHRNPILPPSKGKGATCSSKTRREKQNVLPQGILFGISGAVGHLPSDTYVFSLLRWILAFLKAMGLGERLSHPAELLQPLKISCLGAAGNQHQTITSVCPPILLTSPCSCLPTSHLHSWTTQTVQWVAVLSWLCGQI